MSCGHLAGPRGWGGVPGVEGVAGRGMPRVVAGTAAHTVQAPASRRTPHSEASWATIASPRPPTPDQVGRAGKGTDADRPSSRTSTRIWSTIRASRQVTRAPTLCTTALPVSSETTSSTASPVSSSCTRCASSHSLASLRHSGTDGRVAGTAKDTGRQARRPVGARPGGAHPASQSRICSGLKWSVAPAAADVDMMRLPLGVGTRGGHRRPLRPRACMYRRQILPDVRKDVRRAAGPARTGLRGAALVRCSQDAWHSTPGLVRGPEVDGQDDGWRSRIGGCSAGKPYVMRRQFR
jgi:hypothetical protein